MEALSHVILLLNALCALPQVLCYIPGGSAIFGKLAVKTRAVQDPQIHASEPA